MVVNFKQGLLSYTNLISSKMVQPVKTTSNSKKSNKKPWEPKTDSLPTPKNNQFYSYVTYSLDTKVALSKEVLDNFAVIDSKDYPLPPEAPKNMPDYRMYIPKDPHKLQREGKSHIPDIYGGIPKQETWEEYYERMEKRKILNEYLANCMKKK